jgi:ferredoxin--NADP+ reductase
MDLLYGNDAEEDLTNYYDEGSFKAFGAIISRPMASESDTLEAATKDHADEILGLMRDPTTYTYLAGLAQVSATFDRIMEKEAGGAGSWAEFKEDLRTQGRWSELIYS